MYVLLLKTLLLTHIIFGGLQGDDKPEAKLVHRFEREIDQYSISQAVYASLKEYREDSNNIIVLRVCSQDRFPLSLYSSAVIPVVVRGYIQAGWLDPFPQERIPFIRSEACRIEGSTVAPVEVWVVPKGASLPPHVESVQFCQLRFSEFAWNKLKGRPHLSTRREYQMALRKLVTKLRRNPQAVALFWGQYLRKPGSMLEKNLRDLPAFMEQQGFRRDRYLTKFNHFGGDYLEDTPEPQYPDITTVEVSARCRRSR
ncbi:MAG TPA: hypothetical protein VGB76_18310 [Pyrinomonadaceae bacterium]|jgi:hypothetical protein